MPMIFVGFLGNTKGCGARDRTEAGSLVVFSRHVLCVMFTSVLGRNKQLGDGKQNMVPPPYHGIALSMCQDGM